jgi:hypothetical protein
VEDQLVLRMLGPAYKSELFGDNTPVEKASLHMYFGEKLTHMWRIPVRIGFICFEERSYPLGGLCAHFRGFMVDWKTNSRAFGGWTLHQHPTFPSFVVMGHPRRAFAP